jgi:hypothetical protein
LHLPRGERLHLLRGVVLDDEPRVRDARLREATVRVLAGFAGAAHGVDESARGLPRPDADGHFRVIRRALRRLDLRGRQILQRDVFQLLAAADEDAPRLVVVGRIRVQLFENA